jgi:lipopolysaccharide transport system ATP-binding protein
LPGWVIGGFRKRDRDFLMSSEESLERADVGSPVNNDMVVRVAELTKSYRIYEKPEDRLKESLLPPFQRLLGLSEQRYCKEFDALKNVSFEIRKGETMGIVGVNGSGKSTLLQMICGTLNPSGGTVSVQGRVAALLELGSGFNPEFTGVENVYMSAAILGMSAEEVGERFHQIAAFADIGEFIEQPVKTYSSGMMVRLAFAVIAHVDADILIIDEALAVGDAIFQQRCMRFIHAFKERGTLLFVSHDMGAVQNLCETSIWLEEGEIRGIGPSKEIADAYLQSTLQAVYGEEYQLSTMQSDEAADDESPSGDEVQKTHSYSAEIAATDTLKDASGWQTGDAELTGVVLSRRQEGEEVAFSGGEAVRMKITAITHKNLSEPILGFIVKDRLGQDLFGENTLPFTAATPVHIESGATFSAEFDFQMPYLPNGDYVVMASVAEGTLHDHVQHHYLHDALVLTVASSNVTWGLMGIPFQSVAFGVTHEE